MLAPPSMMLLPYSAARSESTEFIPDDPDTVWIIEEGFVDLFLCKRSREGAFGRRRHLLHLCEGEIICGIAPHSEGYLLVAKPLIGSSVRRCSLNDFADPGEMAVRTLVERQMHTWIDSLIKTSCDSCLQGPSIRISPGDELTVPLPTRALVAIDSLLWLSHKNGCSFFRNAFFLASTDIPLITGPSYFPVTSQSWLQSAPGAVVSVVSTTEARTAQPGLPGLGEFHKVLLALLVRRSKEEEERLNERTSARNQTDRLSLRSALFQLAAPFQPRSVRAQRHHACQDQHFLAASMVGYSIGIPITPPRELIEKRPIADPVLAIARASHIRIRTVILEGQWWRQDHGPLVASTNADQKPRALLWGWRGYTAVDPSSGQVLRVTSSVAGELHPFATTFYRPFPARPLRFIDLLRHAAPDATKEVTFIIALGLAAGLTSLLTPIAVKIIFDQLIPGAERKELLEFSALLAFAGIAAALLNYVRGLVVLRLEGKVDASLQAAIWDRLLHLPVTFFREYNAGDLADRCLAVTAMRSVITSTTMSGVLSGVFSIFSYLQLFFYSSPLALVATGLVALAFLVTILCGLLQVRYQRSVITQNGRISGLVLEFLIGVTKLRVASAESRAFAVWARHFAHKKSIAIRSRYVSNLLSVFLSIFPLLSTGVLFYAYNTIWSSSASHGTASGLTTGTFMAFFSAFIQFLTSFLLFSGAVVGAASVLPLYERVKPILVAPIEADCTVGEQHTFLGAVELNHVSFRYGQDGPEILKDLSLSVAPGEFVAVVGPSGGGKSTLLRLLLGFEKPHSGTIFYDSRDLNGLDINHLRRQIGVVLQSSSLQAGSIYQNLASSAPLTHEDAWNALRLASLEEDVRAMPMGLNTVITGAGGGLSGGQRQRLLIAKALVRRPRILLLDEATSALDNATQSRVSLGLERHYATRIVIAHRLSTVLNAHRIYVLDQGNFVQTGTYNELINTEGTFRELAKRQVL